MTYELALQLKEAGFPQEGNGFHSQLLDSSQGSGVNVYRPDVYYPTLEELVEELGDESVIVLTIGKAMTTALHGVSGLVTNGSTPKVAVAELYIALNKK